MGRLGALLRPCGGPMQDLHRGTITRAYCRAIYEESVSRCFILPPLAGEVRRSRIGGGERSEPICRMLTMPYDTESKSRNADFISIALRAIRHLQRRRRCRPLSESDAQNVVSRFPCGDTTLLHNLRRQPRPFSLKSAPEGRHHHPLNPLNLLNLLNPLNPHAAGVSKGGAAVAP